MRWEQHHVATFSDGLRSRIAANLAAFPREAPGARSNLRHAAVAVVCVGDDEGRPGLLITRRGGQMRAHGGQWALPGGRVDAGESAERAARRELVEELGYAAGACLGRLDDYPTRSGYRISPMVFWGEATPELRPNPDEVAEVHTVAFADIGSPRFLRIPQSDRPVIQMPMLGTLLHAPTGAVVHQFLEVGLHGRQTRVAGYDQPVFAWR